jgi:hypothetical protein
MSCHQENVRQSSLYFAKLLIEFLLFSHCNFTRVQRSESAKHLNIAAW